jgi:2-polyprenyl-3-methyl-5-hydroxy-6-metoxy-1,4-benzoquinol methylase
MIHQTRLNNILDLFNKVPVPNSGKLGDFGCSDGYIIEIFQNTVFKGKDWHYYGFDHAEEYVKLAVDRKLPNSEFYTFDLNILTDKWAQQFDFVTCFETLEHTGDYKNAIMNLYTACKVGGAVILSIPNEKGFQGFTKYAARRILRRNAYEDFFDNRSEVQYALALILNRPIEPFRQPPQDSWGPHLGFDWTMVEKFINEALVVPKKCELIHKGGSFFNFNRLYVIKRLA